MGMDKKAKQRQDIPQEFKWDIEDMFADAVQWEEAMKKSLELGEQFASFSGRLGESGEVLLEACKYIPGLAPDVVSPQEQELKARWY